MSRVTTLGRWIDVLGAVQIVQAAVLRQFEACGVELPDRQYIAAGLPAEEAWDCEQLVVACQGVAWGVAEEAYQQTVQSGTGMSVQGTRHAVIEVSLVRGITTTNQGRNGQPSVEDMNADGVRFMMDCGIMSQGMIIAASDLAADGIKTAATFPNGLVARPGIIDPIGPSGGYVGVNSTMYVSLTDLNTVS
jgi:hypothetical protein